MRDMRVARAWLVSGSMFGEIGTFGELGYGGSPKMKDVIPQMKEDGERRMDGCRQEKSLVG